MVVAPLAACGAPASAPDDGDGDGAPLRPDGGGSGPNDSGPSGCGPSVFLTATSPGPDGVWGTDDDAPIVSGERWTFDGNAIAAELDLGGPGDDGTWGTDDDQVMSWSAFRDETAAMRHTQLIYNGPGLDGAWLTDDDVVGSVEVRDGWTGWPTPVFTDGRGYTDPGADGVLDTADDVLTTWQRASVDDGVRRFASFKVGPDGQPRTADDIPEVRTEVRQVDDGLEMLVSFPGPDGLLDTADDVAMMGVTYGCSLGTTRVATGPGADATWFTDDDVVPAASRLASGSPCTNVCDLAIW